MNQWVFSNRLWKEHLEIFFHLHINVVNIFWKILTFQYVTFFFLFIYRKHNSSHFRLFSSRPVSFPLCLPVMFPRRGFPVCVFCDGSLATPLPPKIGVAPQFTAAPRGGSAASRNLRDLSWDTLIALGCPGKQGRHQSVGGWASPGQPQRYRFDEDSTQTPRGRHNVEGHNVEPPFSNV